MTQPRKEQIKNLKTKYTGFTSVGTLSLGAGPVQDIVNTGIENFYDNLLNSTITKVVGGSETSAPGMLFGSAGPFVLAAGNSFSITLPGVNGGLAITVTLLAGDIITLNTFSVTTVNRIANRINTTLSGFGVTVLVATNVEGELILTAADSSGYTYGDSSSITIQDITPGVVSVLGIATATSAIGNGTTAPKRGVVTVSRDGLGGIVQLKDYKGAPARPVNPPLLTTTFGETVSESAPGSPVFARLRAFPGAAINGRKFEFSYFRNGPIGPRIRSGVSASSNFTSILNTEAISIVLNYGDGNSTNVSGDFSIKSPIVTAQDVVDQINYGYRLVTIGFWVFGAFLGPVVKLGKGPFTFTDQSTRDSFFIGGNGLAPIHINPPSTVVSDNDFANYINAEITTAGQTNTIGALQGFDGAVHIFAQNTLSSIDPNFALTPNSAYTATVEIYPGNPGGSVPGSYMDTLNYLGVSTGQYKAATCARVIGGDEIEIFCPSSLPGASLQITGTATIMGKLGLPASVNVSATTGIQPVISPPVRSLLPEMMEFSEETDNYDSNILDFKNEQDTPPFNPTSGTANAGLPAILGKDGSLDASAIPKILEYLNVNSLKLGGMKAGATPSQYKVPSLELPFDGSSNFSLIWEVNDSNSSLTARLYSNQSGKLIYTNNAYWDGTLWNRDASFVSSVFEISPEGIFSFGSHNGSATWTDLAWVRSTKINESGFGANDVSGTFFPPEILRLGENLLTGTQADVPRISTVVNPSSRVLVQKISSASRLGTFAATTSGDVYIYSSLTTTGASFFEIVVNASFDSGTSLWTKNINGNVAVKYQFGQTEFTIKTRDAATAGTWNDSSWSRTQQTASFLTPFLNSLAGGINIGTSITNAVTSPRLSMSRYDPANEHRTLLFESPITGTGATQPIRIYANTSSAFLEQGFTLTKNARWDSSLDLWIQDVPAAESAALHFGDTGDSRFAITTRPAGTLNWADTNTGWDLTKAIKITDEGTNFLNFSTNGEFKYLSDKTKTVGVPISSGQFSTSTTSTTWFFRADLNGWRCNLNNDFVDQYLAFEIPAPTGSTITSIVITCDDASVGGSPLGMLGVFRSRSNTANSTSNIASAFSSGGGSLITIPTSTLINRELNNYEVIIYPNNNPFGTGTVGDMVYRVQYTFTDAGPRNY